MKKTLFTLTQIYLQSKKRKYTRKNGSITFCMHELIKRLNVFILYMHQLKCISCERVIDIVKQVPYWKQASAFFIEAPPQKRKNIAGFTLKKTYIKRVVGILKALFSLSIFFHL